MVKVTIPLGLDIDVYQEVENRRTYQKQSRSAWINCELRKILLSVEADASKPIVDIEPKEQKK